MTNKETTIDPTLNNIGEKITLGQEHEPELSRRAALITLARVHSYSELNAANLEEGDEVFKQKTRELWQEFILSGRVTTDKNGNTIIQNSTDLDGRSAMGILQLAGISTRGVKFVAPGGFEENAIAVDTSNKDGLTVDVVVSDNGVMEPLLTASIDHHGPNSKNDSSATKIAYETVVSLGLLEKTPELDSVVEFVTHIDNRTFPNEEKFYKDAYRTVLGMERFMSFGQLREYFKSGRKPTEILTPQELKDMNLKTYSEKEYEKIKASQRRLEEMREQGFVIATANYGKIAVDVSDGKNKTLPGGFMAAKAFGCGGYVIWSPQSESFFVSTVKPLEIMLPQGRKVRECMWIKARQQTEPLSIKLETVLNALSGGKLSASGELKKVLSDEKKGVVTLKFGAK